MASRKVPLPGFAYGGPDLTYSNISTTAYRKSLKYAKPSPGTSYTAGGNVVFDMLLGSNEFARFLERPIMVEYRISVKHETTTASEVPAEVDKFKKAWWNANMADFKNIGINPAHSVSVFFSGATISLNNQIVTDGIQLGELSHIYKVMNKIFSTGAQRRRDGCSVFYKVTEDYPQDDSNSAARKKALMLALTGVAYGDDETSSASVSLDGYPFLGLPRNNSLCTLDDSIERNEQNYIPPDTRITIQLHIRSNLSGILDWGTQDDDRYFASAEPALKLVKDAKVDITSIRLGYESFIPDSPQLQKELGDHLLPYHMDIPKLSTYLLQSKTQHSETGIFVPAGSKIFLCAYMYGHSIWANAGGKRNASARFNLPANINNISFELADHGELISLNLGRVGGRNSYNNPVLRGYIDKLNMDGVVEDPFDLFFPQGEKNKSYMQVFFSDLRPYRLNDRAPTTIRVTTSFDAGDTCPDNFYIVACFVTENLLSTRKGGVWEVTRVTQKSK